MLEHCNLASKVPEFDVVTIDELLCNLQGLFVGIGLDDFEAFEVSVFTYDISTIIAHHSALKHGSNQTLGTGSRPCSAVIASTTGAGGLRLPRVTEHSVGSNIPFDARHRS